MIAEPSGCEALKLSESAHIVSEIGKPDLELRACLADGSQDRLLHGGHLMSEHMFHPRPDPGSALVAALLGRRQGLLPPGALMHMVLDSTLLEAAVRPLRGIG